MNTDSLKHSMLSAPIAEGEDIRSGDPRSMIKLFKIHAILVLISIVGISACDNVITTYDYKIEMVEGKFITPRGEFDIDVLTDITKYDRDGSQRAKEGSVSMADRFSKDRGFLVADDGMVSISIAALRRSMSNLIIHDAEFGRTLKFTSIGYTLSGKIYPISFDWPFEYGRQSQINENLKRLYSSHLVNMPIPLAEINVGTVQGGSFLTPTVLSIQKNEDKIHHLILKFKLNNELYTFDAQYKFKLVKDRHLGMYGATH